MRYKWHLIFLLVFAITSSFNTKQEGVTVTITGLRNTNGHVLLSLFKDGKGFPDKPEKAFRKERLNIAAGKATVHLNSLPPGNYAIAILHDENDDLKMKTNWLGIPVEGYGFSNNVMGVMGPPSFTKAQFTITSGKTVLINIKTRYF